MNDVLILKQNIQESLNIIEALQFYKDNAIKPMYKPLIEQQLQKLALQLEIQNVTVYVNDLHSSLIFGEKVKFQNSDAVIVGVSDDEGLIKIAISEDNRIKILEVPLILLSKCGNC